MTVTTTTTELLDSWGGSSAKGPAHDYSGIAKGSGFKAYIEKNRAMYMAQHDALLAAASHLEKLIQTKGRWWLRNLDAKFMARKITKPMRHAAALSEEAARALSSSWALYLGAFSVEKPKTGDFDPTK